MRSGEARLLAYRIAVVAAVFAVWVIGARRSHPLVLPSPSRVARSLWEHLGALATWEAVLTTLTSFVVGFGLALIVGLVVGAICGLNESAAQFCSPFIRMSLTTPMSALVPIMIVTFGLGLASKAAMVLMFALGVVVVNTMTGFQNRNPELEEMVESFNASPWTRFRRLSLPSASPAILAGIRLGAGRAVIGMVVAELIISPVGLGRMLARYRAQFRSDDVFAIVVLLLVLGAVILFLVRRLERRALRWRSG